MTTNEFDSAAVTKACCTAAYEHDLTRLILGESYHPGGRALTRRLADNLRLQPGQRVLDIASGPGTTGLFLAREYGVVVDGVDLGERTVAAAARAAADAGLADRVRFHVGDAERLPFDDASFDAIVCECAFCTFPDKPTAAAEFARVLRPRGQLGLADVTVAPGGLPGELAGLAGWVACLADARSTEDYIALLAGAGFAVVMRERHDDALARMVEQIGARLTAFAMVAATHSPAPGFDLDRARHFAAQASRAVAAGAAGYVLIAAERTEASPG